MALSGEGGEAPQRATINPGGIVNAASFAAEVSPGGIGSLFGVQLAEGAELADKAPLPLSLGGADVWVGGWPAPLFFASSNQINFQTPVDVTGRSIAEPGTTNGNPRHRRRERVPVRPAGTRPDVMIHKSASRSRLTL
jgi:uncharacterized protein (TIGR03437 family)